MPQLTLRGRPVESVYQLLGTRENDMTYALGWTLARCHPFLAELLGDLGVSEMEIALQVRLRNRRLTVLGRTLICRDHHARQ